MGDRRMVYPYTFTAKIALFPFKFYYNNSVYFRSYIWGVILAAPIFWKIQKLTCSETNIVRQEEYFKKQEGCRHEHKLHLL